MYDRNNFSIWWMKLSRKWCERSSMDASLWNCSHLNIYFFSSREVAELALCFCKPIKIWPSIVNTFVIHLTRLTAAWWHVRSLQRYFTTSGQIVFYSVNINYRAVFFLGKVHLEKFKKICPRRKHSFMDCCD